ncbi:MAG TPA: efflux RND transporter permease subunit, partial [Allocoleopsis sp.]
MNISELFIRRPVMTTLVMLGILLFGLMSYFSLPVSDLPNVDFPTIQVSASLPGGSPETMATSVATPLEKQFSTIAGLSSMNSTSSLGSTKITLQFDLSRDIDGAAQDVQAAIAKATRQLPSDMPNPPSYSKVNPADQPVLYVALSSSILPLSEVDKYAETLLAQRLSMVDGVAQVQVYGSQKYAVRIYLDPQALSAKGLGVEEVGQAISQGNANLPTGTLYGKSQNYTIKANGQLNDAKGYRSLVVAYRNDAPVYLGDLGSVVDSVENDKVASWYNGTRSIVLAVQRQPGTNTVEVVNAIEQILPKFRDQIPAAVDMNILFDRSQAIRESVDDVQFTLLLTICLVVLVIFLFLRNLSATIIPSLAVPLSLIATFAVMLLLGYSLDNLSLMALTLAVGFVVDDAVVMLENIVRHIEMGEKPFQAALKGSKEIGFTILSMTLSLVAVFIPVMFMGGILGRLFREFAVTMAVSILVSGFISLTLTPMLCSRFLRAHHEPETGGWEDGEMGRWGDGETGRWGDGEMGRWGDGETGRWGDGETDRCEDSSNSQFPIPNSQFPNPKSKLKKSWKRRLYDASESVFDGMLAVYDWSLKLSLKYHRTTMAVSAAILVATMYLFVIVPKGFIPNVDTGQISANTKAAADISFEEMVKHQQAVARIIEKNPNVEGVNSSVGAGGPNAAANAGRIFIRLKERSHRQVKPGTFGLVHMNADDIVQQLRPKLSRIPGIQVFLTNPPAINIGGQQTKAQYQYTLSSPSFQELAQYSPALEDKLRELPQLQDVNSDLEIRNPQVQVQINRDQASAYGLTANQNETALNNAYGTRQVSTILAPEDQYQVIMGLDPKYQQDPSAIDLLY